MFYPLDVTQFEKPEQPIDIWSLNVDEEEREKKKAIADILKVNSEKVAADKPNNDDDEFGDYAEEEKIQ